MSEEEKQAIKECDIIFMCLEDMMSEESANDYRLSYRIMKDIINNQQKEIEELRKENFDIVYIQAIENYKDKIREKIKEIENEHTGSTKNALSVLQELLDE